MPEELCDFNNLIMLKNHLCRIPESELLKLYQDYGAYLSFLDSVALLTQNDSGFILFSDVFIQKILSVINIHRFDFDDMKRVPGEENPEEYSTVRECVNDIIDYMHAVQGYSDELANALRKSYFEFQEEARETKFRGSEDMLKSVAYDAYVFRYLMEGKQANLADEEHNIYSLNYLMKAVPEFFQDPEINRRAIEVLDRAGEHAPLLSTRKKHVKKAKEGLLSLVQKED